METTFGSSMDVYQINHFRRKLKSRLGMHEVIKQWLDFSAIRHQNILTTARG